VKRWRTRPRRGGSGFAIALLACTVLPVPARRAAAQRVAERVHERLEALPGDTLLSSVYGRRDSRLIWVGEAGPSPGAWDLLGLLDGARAQGLDPDAYPRRALRALLEQAPGADSLARLELLATRAFVAYGTDLACGLADPTAVDSLWTRTPCAAALGAALESLRPVAALARLAPHHEQYARLRGALARYRLLAAQGGWPTLAAGPDLVPGTDDPRIPTLRARLALEGDLAPQRASAHAEDSALARAVRRFQARHGLPETGVVGRVTRAALNVPVEQRVRQIELNLERWRWLPEALGDRYVMVNSAAFVLRVEDRDRVLLETRVIVGRPDWPTPITGGPIRAVIFSPVWTIPRAIALQEIVPLIRRAPDYAARHGITVFRDSAGAWHAVDPARVDWAAASGGTFPFRLEQAPGGDNPLGGMKLVLATPFNVTVHATPGRAAFAERVRTLSHGCVRVEHAAALATELLADSTRWPLDSVRARMTQRREEAVPLVRPVPAYLGYWTAWVDEDGTVQFRDDVYGWDRRLGAALAARSRGDQ
jgi:L,D-transpeptidase YcbB